MREAYRSGRAERLTLRLEAPFVMDGEEFEPGEDGLLHVSATESARFLSL